MTEFLYVRISSESCNECERIDHENSINEYESDGVHNDIESDSAVKVDIFVNETLRVIDNDNEFVYDDTESINSKCLKEEIAKLM